MITGVDSECHTTQLAPFSVWNVTCHLSCGPDLTISVTLGNITSARAISHLPQMLFNLRVLLENQWQCWQNQKSFQGWAPVLKADVINVSEGDWTHSQGPDSAPCGSFKAHIHNYFWFPHTDLVLAQVKKLKSGAIRTSRTLSFAVTWAHLLPTLAIKSKHHQNKRVLGSTTDLNYYSEQSIPHLHLDLLRGLDSVMSEMSILRICA